MPPIDRDDRAVSQLMHDLRNHLSIIKACTERIFCIVPAGQADEEIAELRRVAVQASRLARELLAASASRHAAPERVDLNRLIAGAAADLSRLTAGRTRLQLRLSPEPIIVVAQPMELQCIFVDLALNARDAMADGGVVTVATSVIDASFGEISGAPAGRYGRLTVSDTGCGMTPEVMAKIFEPFFTTKTAGTGLGLSSVALGIRQLQGMVSVESEPDVGTSVSVHVPLAR